MSEDDPRALDTSVLLRLIVGEPEEQARTAVAFMIDTRQRGHTVVVPDLVVAEAYFALQKYYQVPKREALEALAKVFESGEAQPETGGCAVEAMRETLQSSAKLGFVDRLIYCQCRKRGLKLVSFEKASSRLKDTIILKPQ